MHGSTASSSLKEVEHNGVPLPQVVTSMLIWFAISVSSPRVGSISAKVVTVDAVDMLVGEDQMGQLM